MLVKWIYRSNQELNAIVALLAKLDNEMVVANLEQKLRLNELLIKQNSWVAQDRVLRSEDFFNRLLKKNNPEFTLVDKSVALAVLKTEFIDPLQSEPEYKVLTEDFLFDFIGQAFALLAFSEKRGILQDWFSENPRDFLSWGYLIPLAQRAYRFFLDKKILEKSWLPGFFSEHHPQAFFARPLVLNLGFNISQLEAEVFLSEEQKNSSQKLLVLCPQNAFYADAPSPVRKAYQDILNQAGRVLYGLEELQNVTDQDARIAAILTSPNKKAQQKEATTPELNRNKENFSCHRFAGGLAEIKFVLNEIKLLLKKGVPAEDIGVFCAQEFEYKALVDGLMPFESFCLNGDLQIPALTKPFIHQWYWRLKICLGHRSYRGLTAAAFGKSKLVFADFEKSFSRKLNEQALAEFPGLGKLVQHPFSGEAQLGNKEFLELCFYAFSDLELVDTEKEEIFNLIKKAHELLVLDFVWPKKTWELFLDRFIKTQVLYQERRFKGGVGFFNSYSSFLLPCKHRFFLGLSQECLGQGDDHSTQFAASAERFTSATGLFFTTPKKTWPKEDLELSYQDDTAWDYFLFSVQNQDGKTLTPSLFWLRQKVQEHLRSPHAQADEFFKNMHHWDLAGECELELLSKNQDLLSLLEIAKELKPYFKKQRPVLKTLVEQETDLPAYIDGPRSLEVKRDFILRDLNGDFPPSAPWELANLKISAGALERFVQCPFIYFAEKIVRLKTEDPLDVELGPMSRGSLLHKAFEILLKTPGAFEFSEDEVYRVLKNSDSITKDLQKDFTFEIHLLRLTKMVCRFLAEQKLWQQRYPLAQPYLFEAEFSGFVGLESGAWYSQEAFAKRSETKETCCSVSGKIDRLDLYQDKDSGSYFILVDYKSSVAGKGSPSAWLANGDVQMFFYARSLESGLINNDIKKPQLLGAYYYDIKTHKKKGFAISDDFPLVIEQKALQASRGFRWEKPDYEKAQNEFGVLLKKVLNKIKTAQFAPEPLDQKNCITCPWRKSCRSPHLNT